LPQEQENVKGLENDGVYASRFNESLRLPVHRWYRFPAGFSARWVKDLIMQFKTNDNFTVFDPFVGSGTTLLCGEECGVNTLGIDAHPFFVRIAHAKLCWRTNLKEFEEDANHVLSYAKNLANSDLDYPKLVLDCFSKDSLQDLDRLKKGLRTIEEGSPNYELVWLALISILRPASQVECGPWQYVLPKNLKSHYVKPFVAFESKIALMIKDMAILQKTSIQNPPSRLLRECATTCSNIENASIDLVITSPPYPNNYDYADATRLEMSFLGETKNWSDLHKAVRQYLIRSCSQHMNREDKLEVILSDKNLKPILNDLEETCNSLKVMRNQRKGKKRYDVMVAAYFSDLAQVWLTLKQKCKKDATICFVVGDSAPYGIHVPVEKWLGELALSAGFESYKFEKIRCRNNRWVLERKHKTPLHEGRLWVS
jgi:DNA modification methylase